MDNHLGAGVEIIQRDKRIQVGEQLLHGRSNFFHDRSNVARIPLLLTRAHIRPQMHAYNPKQAPHQQQPRCRRNRREAHDLPLRHSAANRQPRSSLQSKQYRFSMFNPYYGIVFCKCYSKVTGLH
jgi:hypothetical protein